MGVSRGCRDVFLSRWNWRNAIMIQATIFLVCVSCNSVVAHKVIPLEVPMLMCAQSAEQAVALAWPDYRIERIECPTKK
jgi:hypothetical protein